jgi:para-aminobenzoate synthetase/4-amino-4-deoxychorismate lyase
MIKEKKYFLFPGEGLFLNKPSAVITCSKTRDIPELIKKAQDLIDEGYYLAGYFSYEFGHCLHKKSGRPFESQIPLFYLAAYKNISAFFPGRVEAYTLGAVKTDTGIAEYTGRFRKIQNLIRRGEIYQVNGCFKLKFNFKGDAFSFLSDLDSRQDADYTMFVNDGERQILSISPELFFSIKDGEILMKPMKGTVIKSPESGVRSPESEIKNEKNIAENIMIVDLIRNDLGKICEISTVKSGPLFEVKEYKTLYQMTSTVRGTLKKDIKLMELLAALFPSGSVTGAPKIRAMQVIRDTEKSARGIYTGAIGFIGPKMKTAVFNVPIRTIVIDKKGKAEMGIGSGIVHDSKAGQEYEECLGKAKFLFPSLKGYKLIESLLLKNGKYFLLGLHLKRLIKSAAYFGVPVDKYRAIKVLKPVAVKHKKGSYKVRLVVDAAGKMKVSVGNAYMRYAGGTRIRVPYKQQNCIAISNIKMNSTDVFLRHKTTRREVYDAQYKKYLMKGFYDVLFLNERGELTEAHSSNVFIEKNGIFCTPPVSCGLLAGTYREMLLAKGVKYREKVLYKKDLKNADAVYICNSVRGMREVKL